ncbi:MAG: di-trans,poly-cis-decaprenylcistransferase [Planctomycetota bacterium]|nr:MAG: di-trans,poly-cis-decaprenylcistransferase [Planctomycetota bacterium]
MDGNGRWAKGRGLRRIRGHQRGTEAVRTTVTECARLGMEALTLYAFSSENWKRPAEEVSFLMRMLDSFLVSERELLMENNVRLLHRGHVEKLPAKVQATLRATEELTKDNDGLQLCLALSYGGRQEIVDAARQLALEVQRAELDPESIDEELFASRLEQAQLPDPDLLIRTAGEMRVSNFLLWQISYSEFWVTQRCWPEFGKNELHEAIRAYARRVRRFGGLPEQDAKEKPMSEEER